MLNVNCLIFTMLVFLVQVSNSKTTKPNIIFILADDLGMCDVKYWIYWFLKYNIFVGWNDVGYHNDKVISPNIDRLASEGITLGRNQGLINAAYYPPTIPSSP